MCPLFALQEVDAENEFPLVEGESTADRRKRIKAIRSGQEKFAKIGNTKVPHSYLRIIDLCVTELQA